VESSRPHSEDWLNDTRDAWWNRDFLQLLAGRFGFGDVGEILDVGSGQGHWGRALLPVLPRVARLTGVDREADWREQAEARSVELGIADRATYVTGEVERLPFADATFDLVTCQTVLIHVADVNGAIEEMLRVLRPDGRIVVVEPNNAAAQLIRNSVTSNWPVERRVRSAWFQMVCEMGKTSIGLGDNSVGDEIPGLFAAAGVQEVDVYLADKVASIFPPYGPETRELLEDELRLVEGRMGPWPRDETRRYFLAGGGSESEFEDGWAARMEQNERIREEIQAGRFWSAGASVMYVVGGRKVRSA
jgi:ubiquinone/menaquinone biosynthesis C-methylase UbiE